MDRFMRDRLLAKDVPGCDISVIPPWSHDEAVRYDPVGREAFRRQYGIQDRFVVMYAGNHSPCHPLDTLLEAALELAHDSGIVFCFSGGGTEAAKVERFVRQHRLENILPLPYQPLERLSACLSAADLHVAVMGDAFVGIVHPCKIYNILRLGIPFLYIGPGDSHIGDLAPHDTRDEWAFFVRTGDAAAASRCIRFCAERGHRRFPVEIQTAERFSQSVLLPRLITVLSTSATERAAESFDRKTPDSVIVPESGERISLQPAP